MSATQARRPRSLRSRLFVGIAATVAVSIAVTLAVGALLTRRSLDEDARRSLARQADLVAAQHEVTPIEGKGSAADRPLPGDRAGAPRRPHAGPGRAAAPTRRSSRPAGTRLGRRNGRGARRALPLRGPDRGRRRRRAAALGAQPVRRLDAVPRRPRPRGPGGRAAGGTRGARAGTRGRAARDPRCRREPAARSGREPRPASRGRAGGGAPARDCVQRALRGAPPGAGRGARLPALGQPRAEDAADGDPRARRRPLRRRRRGRARRRRDRARGAAPRTPDP